MEKVNVLNLDENQTLALMMCFESEKKKKTRRVKKRRGKQIYPFPIPWVIGNPGEGSSDYIAGADSYMV